MTCSGLNWGCGSNNGSSSLLFIFPVQIKLNINHVMAAQIMFLVVVYRVRLSKD
jgi:hypothetical protein